MGKNVLYSGLAIVLGGLGAALRFWQLSDYQAGLPARGDLAGPVLVVLCVASMVIFAVLAWKAKENCAESPYGGTRPMSAGLYFVSAGCLLISAVLSLKALIDSMISGAQISGLILEAAVVILAVPTVISIAFLGKDAMEGTWKSRDNLIVILPAIYSWVWLIDFYRRHTANPVVWDYAFPLLAISMLLLGSIYRAGYAFEDNKPFGTILTGLCGIFFGMIALPGGYGLANMAATVGMAVYTLGSLAGLLCDVHVPKRAM